MDFSVYRAQVTGVNPAAGTVMVAFALGGNSVPLSHVVACGNATTGLHWLPRMGDWVLVAYEPGMQPQIIAPLLDRTQAAQLTPPLAAGEIRLSGPFSVTGVLTAQGRGVIGTDGVIGSGAPSAATHFLRVTMDGGVTWFKIALSPDP